MIDRELSTSNALLQDIGCNTFAAKRVFGAESPRILARQIRPDGWRPVDAEIKVSDPAHLALTLGGSNLYGKGAYAPIRELLQNAVDAIRARRRIENRPNTWGKIRLSLEGRKGPAGGEVWLHVDDTGTGMSERVLTGPLIDFGKSLWNSNLLQEEFPGLETRGIKPIGKFGIGFFSVFTLGETVRVVTKPFRGGDQEIRALEFNSLSSRPILRTAGTDELPTDFTTRISVVVRDIPQPDLSFVYNTTREEKPRTIHTLIERRIPHLIASVDVDIEIDDTISGWKFLHSGEWENTSAKVFLEEILAGHSSDEILKLTRTHEHLVRPITNASGESFGRAALLVSGASDLRYRPPSSVSVGGFLYESFDRDFVYLGVLTGDTDQVSRQAAKSTVPKDLLVQWATEQARIIDQSRFQVFELLRACRAIVGIGGDPGTLPFCYSSGKFITMAEFERIARSSGSIHMPLHKRYDGNFGFQEISDLGTLFFAHQPQENFIVVQQDHPSDLFSVEDSRRLSDSGELEFGIEDLKANLGGDTQTVHALLTRIWGKPPNLRAQRLQIFSDNLYSKPSAKWVLTLSK